MFNVLKSLLKRYDKWCEELGLTPENKRSCTPYREDPAHQRTTKQQGNQETRSDETV